MGMSHYSEVNRKRIERLTKLQLMMRGMNRGAGIVSYCFPLRLDDQPQKLGSRSEQRGTSNVNRFAEVTRASSTST